MILALISEYHDAIYLKKKTTENEWLEKKNGKYEEISVGSLNISHAASLVFWTGRARKWRSQMTYKKSETENWWVWKEKQIKQLKK